jgi:IS30 family transposase
MTTNNSLVNVINTNLQKKFSSEEISKRLDSKVIRSLDYELCYKTLESVVEETILEYQGTECVEFLKQKYFDKFKNLLEKMSGINSNG